MSWVVLLHNGPDRDALLPLNERPERVLELDNVLERRWDPVTNRWHETTRAHSYVARNDGGESSLTHFDWHGWTSPLAPLSPRQRDCHEYIKLYINTYSTPPTLSQIARALDLGSTAPVKKLVAKLQAKGYLSAIGSTLEVLG
jgi:hypothetical protein